MHDNKTSQILVVLAKGNNINKGLKVHGNKTLQILVVPAKRLIKIRD